MGGKHALKLPFPSLKSAVPNAPGDTHPPPSLKSAVPNPPGDPRVPLAGRGPWQIPAGGGCRRVSGGRRSSLRGLALR